MNGKRAMMKGVSETLEAVGMRRGSYDWAGESVHVHECSRGHMKWHLDVNECECIGWPPSGIWEVGRVPVRLRFCAMLFSTEISADKVLCDPVLGWR